MIEPEQQRRERYRVAEATFLLSAYDFDQLQPYALPEIAFVGRSNSGKSTLLNALCGQKALARVSKTPGRTQAINFFNVSVLHERTAVSDIHEPGAQEAYERVGRHDLHFVDLPGYGYAEVSKSLRKQWDGLLSDYLSGRPYLTAIVLLVDSRRGAQAEEEWIRSHVWPREVFVALTKCDKGTQKEAHAARTLVQDVLGLPAERVFPTSVGKHKLAGVQPLLDSLCRFCTGVAADFAESP